MLKSNLPESIILPDGTVLYPVIGGCLKHHLFTTATSRKAIAAKAKRRGLKYRRVEVLSRNLRGKLDLHRQPYRPTRWIFVEVKERQSEPLDKRLPDDRTTRFTANRMLDTTLEIVIALPNGGSLRCGPGEDHEHGGYLRICDPDGIEIIYWDKAEWAETPELVMGAVFASAMTPIDELLAQAGRSKIVGDHWE